MLHPPDPSPPEIPISNPPLDSHHQSALPQPSPSRSQRQKQPPSYLKDYHCSLTSTTAHNLDSPISSTIRYSISIYISYHRLSHHHKHFTLNVSSQSEPTSCKEVICHESWKQAIQSELSSLMKTNT